MSLASLIQRFRRAPGIIVVSGLPRSGTSMMMRMLAAGGVPILTDDRRAPDANNPLGYFEFEPVKDLASGAEPRWLDQARGKAVKIVSFLLTWLPETHEYQVIFMRRGLREMTASQRDMLGEPGEPGRLERVYADHLEEVDRFLARRTCFSTLEVEHGHVIAHPEDEARRIAAFLGRPLDVSAMASAVDPRLYRHKDA